jgi:hypothetical protein
MFYPILILCVALVIVLWLCYEGDSYLFSGLVLAAAMFRNYEGWACALVVLIFIMMLLREYKEKDSVFRLLWLKIKKKI